MNTLERILERQTIQTALSSNENEIFKGQLTNGDFKWLIEQAEKYQRVRDRLIEQSIQRNHEALKKLADN